MVPKEEIREEPETKEEAMDCDEATNKGEEKMEKESKVKEEDAKAVFLHFTQEQLNSQVGSLEGIVKNLKVENQLLNKAIQKLVVCVNEEKDKLAEEKEKLEEV